MRHALVLFAAVAAGASAAVALACVDPHANGGLPERYAPWRHSARQQPHRPGGRITGPYRRAAHGRRTDSVPPVLGGGAGRPGVGEPRGPLARPADLYLTTTAPSSVRRGAHYTFGIRVGNRGPAPAGPIVVRGLVAEGAGMRRGGRVRVEKGGSAPAGPIVVRGVVAGGAGSRGGGRARVRAPAGPAAVRGVSAGGAAVRRGGRARRSVPNGPTTGRRGLLAGGAGRSRGDRARGPAMARTAIRTGAVPPGRRRPIAFTVGWLRAGGSATVRLRAVAPRRHRGTLVAAAGIVSADGIRRIRRGDDRAHAVTRVR